MENCIIAQAIPDPTEVMKTAAQTDNWVVVTLVFLIVTLVVGFVAVFKMLRDTYQKQIEQAMDRENRLGTRIDKLESEQFERITAMLEKQLDLTAKTEQTLSGFSEGQRAINGDLKTLCSLLSVSPCLVMAKGQGRFRIVDEKGNTVTPAHIIASANTEAD